MASAAPAANATPSKPPPPAGQQSGMTREQAIAYYERMRKDVRDAIARKRLLDKNLAQYEENIFRAEGAYLEDTQQNGNIVKGFDNYIKGNVARRKANFSDADRIFSLSSLTMAAKLQQHEDSLPATASSTPTVADHHHQLPRIATQNSRKKSIKRRKGDDDSDSQSEVETPGPKRVRISFSGASGASAGER